MLKALDWTARILAGYCAAIILSWLLTGYRLFPWVSHDQVTLIGAAAGMWLIIRAAIKYLMSGDGDWFF